MTDMTPPGQHIGIGKHLISQSVLVLIEGRRVYLFNALDSLSYEIRDARMYAVWIDRRLLLRFIRLQYY